jgi:hypothetical protein
VSKRFRAPILARFWREWAELPNRTRGIDSVAITGSKKPIFSIAQGSPSKDLSGLLPLNTTENLDS